MKGFIFFLAILCSIPSWGSRWIVENAKRQPLSFSTYKVIKEFELGSKKYLVVETPDTLSMKSISKSQLSLSDLFSATQVIQDIPIELIRGEDVWEDVASSGWHTQRMRYEELDTRYQGQGVIVAVLDTGVDITHPQLAANIWTNQKEIANNGIDDDINGYIDDVHGWNAADHNNNVMDGDSHGTHCAGIIAAAQNPTRLGRGAAPMATIMPIRLLKTGAQATFLSDAAEAVVYATDNGAQILSNSWRFYKSWSNSFNQQGLMLLDQVISYAGQRGVLFVAAAGNESFDLNETNQRDPIYPLSLSDHIPTIIGIASGDTDGSQDFRSSFTNYGTELVQLAAPGSNIYSTVPGGGWQHMSGTSMATPLAAGALARVVSKGYTPFQAYQVLAATVDASAKSTWDGYVSYGYINIYDALNVAK